MDGLLSLAEGELPKIPRVQWFERARWFGMRVYLEFPWSTSDWTKEVWIQIRGKGRVKALYTKELFLDGCDTYAVAKHVTDATWGVRHLWTELEGGKVLKKKEEAIFRNFSAPDIIVFSLKNGPNLGPGPLKTKTFSCFLCFP